MREPQSGGDQPEMERAEELVDAMTGSLAEMTSRLTRRVVTGAARAREEAEDIWAEAHSRSQRQQG